MLSDKEIEKIAEAVEEKIVNRVYREIGKGVLKKLLWLTLAVLLASAAYFGLIHLPGKH